MRSSMIQEEKGGRWGASCVKFQYAVVHSFENWEAKVCEARAAQETEWTITIMPD